MAEKKKGIGDALIGLFVVREEDEAGKAAGAPVDPAPSSAPAATGGDATVDDLIARYANPKEGGAAGSQGRSTRPPRPGSSATAPPATTTAAPASPPPAADAKTATPGTTQTPAAAQAATPATSEPSAAVPQVEIDADTVLRKAGLTAEDRDRVEKALNLLHTLPSETPLPLKRQIVGASLQAFSISVDQIIESALLHQGAYLRHQREGEKQTQSLLEQSTKRLAELEREAARVKQVMEEQRAQQQGLTFAVSRQKMRLQEVLDFFGPESVERVQQSSVKLRSQDERRGGKDV